MEGQIVALVPMVLLYVSAITAIQARAARYHQVRLVYTILKISTRLHHDVVCVANFTTYSIS